MSHNANLARRDFLKRAAAGAAFSVPAILTRPVFGADAPSNRVNVGQIGCGNIGSNYHIPTLVAMPDVRIVAVADAYKSRRGSATARLNRKYGAGTAMVYADFREILARADVDAVIVGAHDNWHTPMSIAAIQAGKDVYCQKPLELDFGLTGILRNVAREKRRILQFGTQYRSMGRYRPMVRLVRNGYLGKLERIDPLVPRRVERPGRICRQAPEQEKIVNDPETAKMLVRPFPEKWKVW